MHAQHLRWLKRITVAILLSASTAGAVSAQTSGLSKPTLDATLVPGTTVWITDSGGREAKARIIEVSGEILTATTDDGPKRLQTAEVTRVRARHSDSVLNGALIGAGAAVVPGLFLCRAMEPWEVCRDHVGPMLRIGAVGAGIGIGIDALIRGRKTIYQAPQAARLHAAPIVARGLAGLQLSFSF